MLYLNLYYCGSRRFVRQVYACHYVATTTEKLYYMITVDGNIVTAAKTDLILLLQRSFNGADSI